MADIVGVILGLPGTLTACVQCFEMVQFGRQFEGDFGECLIMLKASQLHMARWGVAVGIAQEPLNPEVIAWLKTYPTDEIQTANDLLHQIQYTFEEAQKSAARFSKSESKKGRENGLSVLASDAQLEKAEKRFKTLYTMQCKALAKYRQAILTTHRVSARTSWALYQRSHLTDLVNRISALVSELEELFPAEVQSQVQQQEERLCRDEETRDLNEECLVALRRLNDDRDRCLQKALSVEAKTLGMTFEDITIDGRARTRLGHEFAVVASDEDSIGDRRNHSYKGMRIGGDSISQLGNSYGGPSVIEPVVSRSKSSEDANEE